MDIIVDIDGTIADCRHRIHMVKNLRNDPNWKADWKSFFESMIMDTAIVPVMEAVKILERNGHQLIFCTGRPNNYELHTRDWLAMYGGFEDVTLWMRDKRDCRSDFIVKEYMLAEMRDQDFYPELAFEDKQECVDMWRRNGIICLQNSMREMP